jgi:hypothetical protein
VAELEPFSELAAMVRPRTLEHGRFPFEFLPNRGDGLTPEETLVAVCGGRPDCVGAMPSLWPTDLVVKWTTPLIGRQLRPDHESAVNNC